MVAFVSVGSATLTPPLVVSAFRPPEPSFKSARCTPPLVVDASIVPLRSSPFTPPLVVDASTSFEMPVSLIPPLVVPARTRSPAGTLIVYFTSAPPDPNVFGVFVTSRTDSGFTVSTISILVSRSLAASSLEALAIFSADTSTFGPVP